VRRMTFRFPVLGVFVVSVSEHAVDGCSFQRRRVTLAPRNEVERCRRLTEKVTSQELAVDEIQRFD
jgi:hypothetical protein